MLPWPVVSVSSVNLGFFPASRITQETLPRSSRTSRLPPRTPPGSEKRQRPDRRGSPERTPQLHLRGIYASYSFSPPLARVWAHTDLSVGLLALLESAHRRVLVVPRRTLARRVHVRVAPAGTLVDSGIRRSARCERHDGGERVMRFFMPHPLSYGSRCRQQPDIERLLDAVAALLARGSLPPGFVSDSSWLLPKLPFWLTVLLLSELPTGNWHEAVPFSLTNSPPCASHACSSEDGKRGRCRDHQAEGERRGTTCRTSRRALHRVSFPSKLPSRERSLFRSQVVAPLPRGQSLDLAVLDGRTTTVLPRQEVPGREARWCGRAEVGGRARQPLLESPSAPRAQLTAVGNLPRRDGVVSGPALGALEIRFRQ